MKNHEEKHVEKSIEDNHLGKVLKKIMK